ncbi:MAG: forkhead-associated protein [Chthonomonadales bacterium]|nr:forkhead-associated protein [Chthonomonadales bacterium]
MADSRSCPSCQQRIFSGATYCSRCHSDLTTAPCPQCGQANSRSAVLCGQCQCDLRSLPCPHCQTLNVATAPRCTQCRRSFPGPLATALSLQKTQASKTSPGLGVTLGLGLYLGAFLFSWLPLAFGDVLVTVRALLGAALAPVMLGGGLWLTQLRQHIKRADYLLALASGAAVGLGFSLLRYVVAPKFAVGFGAALVLPVLAAVMAEAGKVAAIRGFLKQESTPQEIRGLLFGILAGLGFAAVDNIVSVLTALHQGEGDAIVSLIGLRILISLAQACWSGTLASMLWREKRLTSRLAPVLGTFLAVTALHALWDYQMFYPTEAPGGIPAVILASAMGTLSLFLFRLNHMLRSNCLLVFMSWS